MTKLGSIITASTLLVVLGAGCSQAPVAQVSPTYQNDANSYAEPSTTTISTGVSQNSPPISENTAAPTPVSNNPTTKPKVTPPKESTTIVAKPATSLTYTKAISTYKTSGAYYQFVACRATPGTMTMKHGTKFMLDNRDNASHTIVIGWNHYVIGPYSFVVATAPAAGKYFIICDGGGSGQLESQE